MKVWIHPNKLSRARQWHVAGLQSHPTECECETDEKYTLGDLDRTYCLVYTSCLEVRVCI